MGIIPIRKKKGSLIHLNRGTFLLLHLKLLFYNCRNKTVLVSTDVAAMGLDVDNLNLSVNIGKTYLFDEETKIREETLSFTLLTHYKALLYFYLIIFLKKSP